MSVLINSIPENPLPWLLPQMEEAVKPPETNYRPHSLDQAQKSIAHLQDELDYYLDLLHRIENKVGMSAEAFARAGSH